MYEGLDGIYQENQQIKKPSGPSGGLIKIK